MFNKFKKGDIVVVNGIGKSDSKNYFNKMAVIIGKDTYFKDYNVKFTDELEDWIDEKYLTLYKDRRWIE